MAVFLGGTSLALVVSMHWIEFRFIVERGGELFIQGRYFLPILPLAACAGAAPSHFFPNASADQRSESRWRVCSASRCLLWARCSSVTMRNLAVAAFGAAFAVVLVALAITAANDKASIAFTNGAAPIGEVLSLPPGRGACEPIRSGSRFRRGPASARSRNAAISSCVWRCARGGSSLGVGDARLPADTGLAVVEFDRQVTERSLTLCVSNRSDARIGLIGAPGERAPRRNGVVRTGDPTLVFLQQPRSLLARIPDAFEHAALFKPGFLGPWTFWFLAFLVLLVAPLLLAAALKRAVEDDATGTPTDDPRGERWRMFQTEVEPRLSAVPRVHRFAQPPLVGDTTLEAQPVAVCIEPADGDVERTRTSLERQTRAPATVLECSAADAAAACRAPYVAFVPAGVELAPVALERLGQAVRLAPDAGSIHLRRGCA